jgi:hypothetical protein
MKLRPIQLVYMVVLLSSLRMAGASILPVGEFGTDGRYLGSVLCQDCSGNWTEITLVDLGSGSGSGTFVRIERFAGIGHGGAITLIPQPEHRFPVLSSASHLALPVASLATYRTAWAMRPPAAQCISIYTITGAGDGTPSPATSL